jgi:hypothetical protein
MRSCKSIHTARRCDRRPRRGSPEIIDRTWTLAGQKISEVRWWPMLSKKSFWGTEQIFLEALMRWSENDVGGHMISQISNRQPS